jgi:hypothetical protein
VAQLGNVAIADDDVRLATEQRGDQARNFARRILVVGVGIDDEVRAGLERGIDAGDECGRQPLVAAETHDVLDAALVRHISGAVARSVVDDQHLHDVDPGDRSRQIGEGRRQRRGFVQTRNLDDEFFHETPTPHRRRERR